jgi:hypothetical protein
MTQKNRQEAQKWSYQKLRREGILMMIPIEPWIYRKDIQGILSLLLVPSFQGLPNSPQALLLDIQPLA